MNNWENMDDKISNYGRKACQIYRNIKIIWDAFYIRWQL